MESFMPDVCSSQLEYVSTIQEHSVVDLPVPDPTRFSSWLRLLKTTALVLIFIKRCRKFTSNCQINCTDMEEAEQLLLRYAQLQSFPEEIAAIKNRKPLERISRLHILAPYLDDYGILRVSGRIDTAADLFMEIKRPIILDGRHSIWRLIVKHYHKKAAHGLNEMVVNELKQKYWILKLRPTVRTVASSCMLCRMQKAKPEPPRMGDLPQPRLDHHQRPFTNCGVDLFGPLDVTIGRRREKRYGVLFTCLTVRAVHIEVVNSLTTDSLIMALRRMSARRGWPKHIFSDNGTNLRGAKTELLKSIKELDEVALKDQALNFSTEWTFIPPSSPHWGGAWERLIRTVKNALKVVLKERAPREEVLITLLAEVENLVNSRALTHVSVEPESNESLTPNHFLLGTSSNLPTIGVYDDSDIYLRKQWRIAQRLADKFWERWVKEFLPELLPRRKWNREQRSLQIGDLVLVVSPNEQRGIWQRGVVERVFPGKDGRTRVVQIKTLSGILVRPATRVARIPMEDECR
ncbi:unnamed protein product [Parnassius mnemosyne]|uniref:Integrase catalytic domain-containing protein n=1 Tax=Parnassius mnemosyne TaxID=213953 RepID=A0AAV1LJ56_9NEOP